MSMTNTQYEEALQNIVDTGDYRDTRTGISVLSKFGLRLEYDLQKGFPLITTKKVHFKSVVTELLWMLRGYHTTEFLHEHGVTIWDEWADPNGDLGRVYGAQWRDWQGADGVRHDQIAALIKGLQTDPSSRRHIVNAWNVAELNQMALPPCHMMFQMFVSKGELSIQVYQRSADMFLGVPFNLASYALLTHLVAHYLGYEVGKLIWVGGDCHIYENHSQQVTTQLMRTPKKFPTLKFTEHPLGSSFDDFIGHFNPDDFWVENYEHYGTLKAPVAV